MLTTEWGNVRYPSCRDKGRLWGRVGCLSWGQREPVGTAWSNQVAPQRGQAQGPLIHSTPPLVPTGRGTHISRFDRQTSSGRWGCKRSDGAIPRFDCQTSLGTRGGCGATRSSGDCVEQPGRTPTRTSTRPPHPLHPAPCPYRTRVASTSMDRITRFGRQHSLGARVVKRGREGLYGRPPSPYTPFFTG